MHLFIVTVMFQHYLYNAHSLSACHSENIKSPELVKHSLLTCTLRVTYILPKLDVVQILEINTSLD